MFKSLLYKLDKPQDNALLKRIEKESITEKYYTALGGTILSVGAIMVFGLASMYLYNAQSVIPPKTIAVQLQKQEQVKNEAGQMIDVAPKYVNTEIISLNAPTHNLKNVSSWLKEAIMATYSFSFNDYDKVVDDAYYYFTSNGYSTYLNALALAKWKEKVTTNLLQVSIIPIGEPIQISKKQVGDSLHWLFRTEVLINYTTGGQVINDKYLVDTLVVQVPPYKSVKGLGIAMYSLTKK